MVAGLAEVVVVQAAVAALLVEQKMFHLVQLLHLMVAMVVLL
jgi:hypothetical protein